MHDLIPGVGLRALSLMRALKSSSPRGPNFLGHGDIEMVARLSGPVWLWSHLFGGSGIRVWMRIVVQYVCTQALESWPRGEIINAQS
jgi:hypothetical protein